MPPTISLNTRATRSRFSSPQQNAAGTVDSTGTSMSGSNATTRQGGSTSSSSKLSGGVTNAQKAMMARWLEPPVQNKTSFEEAGFQRHGVFEGMAPLGSLPKAGNVAKRMSGLYEEKLYHDASFHSGRPNHKQQHQHLLQRQKEQLRRQHDAEVQEEEEHRHQQSQEGEQAGNISEAEEPNDTERPTQPEEDDEEQQPWERSDRDTSPQTAVQKVLGQSNDENGGEDGDEGINGDEEDDTEDQIKGEDEDEDEQQRERRESEHTDRRRRKSLQHPEQQQQPAPQTKKIILKLPNAAKALPPRPMAELETVSDEGTDGDTEESEHDGPLSPDSTYVGPSRDVESVKSPSRRRRNIIIGPGRSASPRFGAAVAADAGGSAERRLGRRTSSTARDDDFGHGDGVGSDKEHVAEDAGPTIVTPSPTVAPRQSLTQKGKQQQQKPKRPVGRPRSRRSIAAENRALKAKADAEAAEAEEAARAAKAAREAEAAEAAEVAKASAVAEDDVVAKTEASGLRDNGSSISPKAHVFVRSQPRESDQVDDTDDTDSEMDDSGDETDTGVTPTWSRFADFRRPRSDSNATVVNKEVTDKVVEIAVDEALRHFRYPTAWALRTLYDEQSSNQNFLAMVEDVFQQTADRETLETFAQMLHQKKKEGKKDNKGCYYFVPPSTNSRFTPHKAKPAPYAHLVTLDLRGLMGASPSRDADADDDGDSDAHLSKRVKLTNATSSSFSPPSVFTTAPVSAAMSAAASAPAATTTNLPARFGVSAAPGRASSSAAEENPSRVKDVSVVPSGSSENIDEASEQFVEAPAQSRKAAKTPTKMTASPKTPTKTKSPSKAPHRTPGSKVKSTTGKMSSARRRMSASKNGATGPVTPSQGRRLRNRAGSLASSISSLSSVMSLSPPGKATEEDSGNETIDGEVTEDDAQVAASDAGDAETRNSKGKSASKAAAISDRDEDTKKKSGKAQDAGAEAPGRRNRRGGAAADGRQKAGAPAVVKVGSGRGGRRRGAGRPPKSKTAVAAAKGPAKTQAPASAPAPAPAPAPVPAVPPLQPIATRNKSSTKKSPTSSLSALISPLSSSSSHNPQTHTTTITRNSHHQNTRNSAAAAAAAKTETTKDMPAVVEGPVSVRSVSVAKRAAQNGSGRGKSNTSALPSPSLNGAAAPLSSESSMSKSASADDEEDRRARLRRESRNITNGVGLGLGAIPESYARGSSPSRRADGASSPTPTAAASGSRRAHVSDGAASRQLLQTPQPQQQNQRQLRASTTTTRTTRSARKRAFDEIDDDLSPTSGGFPSEEPSQARLQTPVPLQQTATANASNLNSRAGTPGPRSKKPRVGLRVKTSPIKRKTGTSAGVPRPSGERGSPVANGIPNNQDDNDDYCASCGGSGELVCCDGCTRSFHFKCVDPPLQEDGNLPDEWFCNVCLSRRNPASLVHHTGVFGALLNVMSKRNSSAFRLPSETRDYFEGVKTGADGEYEDVVVLGTVHRTRKRGYEEAPDFFRIRDADGNTVLCHNCNRSAEENRAIIPCAFCSLWWHIDCLDPPMANPPVLRNWRCPAHADDILAKLPGLLGPAHRFRKIKGAPVIKPVYSRGMINNGFIEFHSDEESDNSGWKDLMTFGRVQRVGARGVQLDFLEQIRKEQRKGKQRHARINRRQERIEARNDTGVLINAAVAAPPVSPPEFLADRRSIDEAQAAHNLTALRQSTDVNTDRSGELINALLSQADASMISMMAQGSALNIETGSALTLEDRAALEAMRARINRLLDVPVIDVSSPAQSETVMRETAVQEIVTSAEERANKLSQDESRDAPPAKKQHAATEVLEAPKSPETPERPGVADARDITMRDAPVADEEPATRSDNRDGREAREEDASKSSPGHVTHEVNEVMSLVSDNGDSDLNEDEDPPPVATPLTAPLEEATSAVWPVEHHSSHGSEPGSEGNGLPQPAEVSLPGDEVERFSICGHGHKKGGKDAVEQMTVKGSKERAKENTAAESESKTGGRLHLTKEARSAEATVAMPPTPLTPPPAASSDTAVDEAGLGTDNEEKQLERKDDPGKDVEDSGDNGNSNADNGESTPMSLAGVSDPPSAAAVTE